ncbi:unnamed protein product [Chrysodeixis includens]|uniref:Uncharacterized protein n=1 Tax=Chrysodeixis includens TaxID=689277 RepID=A0A9N8Q1E7_CHRIL|nr:unnamed protein product [Chrysodeixis includens]
MRTIHKSEFSRQQHNYSREHLVFFFFLTCNAARVAVSNTSRTPSLLLAEHSRYAKALIFSAIARPSCGFTGSCFILRSSLIVAGSLRRSFLLPTRMMGTLGQKCFTSGVHFSGMFSSESGESTEKHMRITSVSGYDSGRSLS